MEEDQHRPCILVLAGAFLFSPSKRREINLGVSENIMAGRIKPNFKEQGCSKLLHHLVASVKCCSKGVIAFRSRRKNGVVRRDDSSLLQSQINNVKGRVELV